MCLNSVWDGGQLPCFVPHLTGDSTPLDDRPVDGSVLFHTEYSTPRVAESKNNSCFSIFLVKHTSGSLLSWVSC